MSTGTARIKLRELYPTLKDFEKAVAKHGSQNKLGAYLNIHPATISDHKSWLEKGKKPVFEQHKTVCRLTDKELDERIREMYGSKDAEVKVYQLTEQYKPNQIGIEGLIPIRTEVSQASVSRWARREVMA